ncbi:hypothetical protein ACWGDX_12980 [Streptomyces sp. NPDC055025]
MSYNQPPSMPTQPQWGPPPAQPSRPKWARKRIVIPAAALLFFVGVGIGTSGSGETEAAASAKPAPTVTVTETPQADNPAADEAKPTLTVTVTKTATPKAAAKPKEDKPEEAPEGQAVFKVWGSAPSGVDVTYGSDGTNLQGGRLPVTKTLEVKDDALYYQVTAQLQGGGDIHCSVTIDGETKTGQAQGGYNICSAQLNGDFLDGWG